MDTQKVAAEAVAQGFRMAPEDSRCDVFQVLAEQGQKQAEQLNKEICEQLIKSLLPRLEAIARGEKGAQQIGAIVYDDEEPYNQLCAEARARKDGFLVFRCFHYGALYAA